MQYAGMGTPTRGAMPSASQPRALPMTAVVDRLCIWLVRRGHVGTAILVWRAAGLWLTA